MHPKLAWIEQLEKSLSSVLGEQVAIEIQDLVDPLKKLALIKLQTDLVVGDYKNLRTIINSFAEANDCVLYKLRKGYKLLSAEILTKTRLGEEMSKNPFLGDKG